jgi:hypothetical protein
MGWRRDRYLAEAAGIKAEIFLRPPFIQSVMRPLLERACFPEEETIVVRHIWIELHCPRIVIHRAVCRDESPALHARQSFSSPSVSFPICLGSPSDDGGVLVHRLPEEK